MVPQTNEIIKRFKIGKQLELMAPYNVGLSNSYDTMKQKEPL
jgi:hypothetical protein